MTELRRCLVVDDSSPTRDAVARMCEHSGYIQAQIADGSLAALRAIEQQRWDLIITDINMPVFDGIKLISLIRSNNNNGATPIIVISTDGTKADIDRALEAGATAYLHKPFTEKALISLLETLLPR